MKKFGGLEQGMEVQIGSQSASVGHYQHVVGKIGIIVDILSSSCISVTVENTMWYIRTADCIPLAHLNNRSFLYLLRR